MPTEAFSVGWGETGITIYSIFRRDVDGYFLDDIDGGFAETPADPYISFSEHAVIKRLYEKVENRTAWNDGRYSVAAYKQTGISPVPASDLMIGLDVVTIKTGDIVYQSGDSYPLTTVIGSTGQGLTSCLTATGFATPTNVTDAAAAVTLANGTHGGAATVVILQSPIDSNVESVNGVPLTGDGASVPWGPA